MAQWERIHLQCRRHGLDLSQENSLPWRRKWQHTPVFLPGKSHGQRSLVGYSPWGHEIRHSWARTHAHRFIIDPHPLQNDSNIFQNQPVQNSQGTCLGAKSPDKAKTPFYEQWIFIAWNNCHYPVGMLTILHYLWLHKCFLLFQMALSYLHQ